MTNPESLNMFYHAFENLQIGITITDRDRKILYTNPADAKLHGHSVQSLLGKDVRLFAPDELRNPLPIEKVMPAKQWQRESLNKTKDGKIFPVLLMSNIITDNTGQPEIIITTCEDISSRRHAEKELQESEKRFRILVENTPIGVWQDNADQKTIYVNPSMCEMLGIKSPEEVQGQGWKSFFTQESLERIGKEHARRLKGIASNYEVELMSKRRTKRTMLVYGAPLFSSRNEFMGTIATFLDITERKNSEIALRDNERFLTSIFKSIQDGLSILDTDLNIIQVNPAIEIWYKHAMPLIGKKCYKAYHDRNDPCEVCPTLNTLRTRESSYEVVPKRGPKGRQIGWLDLFSFPLFDSSTGDLKGVIEYVRDITERKHAEESLKKREEELKQRVNELEEFYEIAVNRELRMIELKKEIDKLTEELKRYRK